MNRASSPERRQSAPVALPECPPATMPAGRFVELAADEPSSCRRRWRETGRPYGDALGLETRAQQTCQFVRPGCITVCAERIDRHRDIAAIHRAYHTVARHANRPADHFLRGVDHGPRSPP